MQGLGSNEHGLDRTQFQTYKWVAKVYLQINCMEIVMGFPI